MNRNPSRNIKDQQVIKEALKPIIIFATRRILLTLQKASPAATVLQSHTPPCSAHPGVCPSESTRRTGFPSR